MKDDKTLQQRQHAKQRFLERHGLDFNRKVRRYFEEKIECGVYRLVQRQSNRVEVIDIRYKDGIYRCVYDTKRRNIVTVFPNDENGHPEEVRDFIPMDNRDEELRRDIEERLCKRK